jgi:hypothetical protein
MSQYHDDQTEASDPGGIYLNKIKLESFRIELPFYKKVFASTQYPPSMIKEHLLLGDSRAAIVLDVSESLIVGAYTDELDCVVLLQFPLNIAREYNLVAGHKLLTVNTYFSGSKVVKDLNAGPESFGRYSNFYPLIADFLSDDISAIESRKLEIDNNEWLKVANMGKAIVNSGSIKPRNGNPYLTIKR